MKLFYTLFFCCFINTFLFSQITVTGKVVDGSGEDLIGANVVYSTDETIGTVTEFDGTFSLELPYLPFSLIVSFTGLKTDTILIEKNSLDSIITLKRIELKTEVIPICCGCFGSSHPSHFYYPFNRDIGYQNDLFKNSKNQNILDQNSSIIQNKVNENIQQKNNNGFLNTNPLAQTQNVYFNYFPLHSVFKTIPVSDINNRNYYNTTMIHAPHEERGSSLNGSVLVIPKTFSRDTFPVVSQTIQLENPFGISSNTLFHYNKGKHKLNTSYLYQQSKEFREHENFNIHHASLFYEYRFKENGIEFFSTFSKQEDHLAGFISNDNYQDNHLFINKNWITKNAENNYHKNYAGIRFYYNKNKFLGNISALGQLYKSNNKYAILSTQENSKLGGFTFYNRYKYFENRFVDFSLIFGGEYLWEKINNYEKLNDDLKSVEYLNQGIGFNGFNYLMTKWEIGYFELEAGTNVFLKNMNVEKKWNDNSFSLLHKKYKPQLFPRLAMRYFFNAASDFVFYGNFQKGQLDLGNYGMNRVGNNYNRNYEVETAWTSEIGVRAKNRFFLYNYDLNFNYYTTQNSYINDYRSFEDYDLISVGNTKGFNFNSHLDFRIIWSRKYKLYLDTHYKYSKRKITSFMYDNVEYTKQIFPNIPEHFAEFVVRQSYYGINLELGYQIQGGVSSSILNRTKNNYHNLSFYLSYEKGIGERKSNSISFFIGGNNLLNQKIPALTLMTVNNLTGENIYPGTGVYINGGIEIDLELKK